MIKKSWKPKLKGLGVEVFWGENGISLLVYSKFFRMRLPLSIEASINLRNAMERAVTQSNRHDWSKKHLPASRSLPAHLN